MNIKLVSRIIRGRFAVMFGMITLHDHTKNGEATDFIWERPNLIRLGTKLAEQALKVISGPNMAV